MGTRKGIKRERMRLNNPSKRAEVREKTSKALRGRKNPVLSERNKLNNPSKYLEVRIKQSKFMKENNPMRRPEQRERMRQNKDCDTIRQYILEAIGWNENS